MKDAKGHGSDPRGGAMTPVQAENAPFKSRLPGPHYLDPHDPRGAHASAVNQVGQGRFRLNSFTHEIVSPTGDVVARMRVGKMNGLAVDQRGVGEIARSGGTAIHDAVAMAGYQKNEFPAEHIGGELHYLTGNDFKGHTVRLATSGPNKADAWGRTAADLKKDYGK
jgi:hypothetical protein